jgi:hypothetical protein
MPDPKKPRRKIEHFGHWVGYAKTVGDALTWKILTEDTNKIIFRSNIRAVDDPVSPFGGEKGSSSPPIIFVHGRLELEGPNGVPTPMLTFDPKDLIGRTFLLDPEPYGLCFCARVKQIAYKLEQDNDTGQIDRIKALIQIDKGDKMIEELITYSSLLDYIQKDEADENDPHKTWRF